jgi:hypothetical protein
MHVIVVMVGEGTSFFTKRIFKATFIVQHFVDKSLVEKSFECSVNRYPVKTIVYLFLDISMRQGIRFIQEEQKYFLP